MKNGNGITIPHGGGSKREREYQSSGERDQVNSGIGTNDTGETVVRSYDVQPQTSRRSMGEDMIGPGWWASLGPLGVCKIVIIIALVSWLYGDHFYRLFRIWQQPDWSHGFLIPVFCLYLVHRKRAALLLGDHTGSLWGLPLMILSVGCYVISILYQFGYPQPLTILSMIAGIVLLLRGWKTLWLTAFPIAFLFLAIPPPVRLYRQLTQPLQQIAAAVSSIVLNTFPGVIAIDRAGINLAFYMEGGEQGTFTVAGACSGMRSLMAFIALGLAMAYLTDRPIWHRVIFSVCVVPVALFCNILRVLITGGEQMYGHQELATGTPHMLLGLMMFALGFIMFMGILWTLEHLFIETPEGEQREGDAVTRGAL